MPDIQVELEPMCALEKRVWASPAQGDASRCRRAQCPLEAKVILQRCLLPRAYWPRHQAWSGALCVTASLLHPGYGKHLLSHLFFPNWMVWGEILELFGWRSVILQQMALLPRKWGWEEGSWFDEQELEQGGGSQALTIRESKRTWHIPQQIPQI